MDTIPFNVKEKSIVHFFEQHAIGFDSREATVRSGGCNISPYHLMKDELYLKQSSGIRENGHVIFELTDEAAGSRTKLLNTYVYQSEKYDDVGIKLKLVDFKVSVVEKPSIATA